MIQEPFDHSNEGEAAEHMGRKAEPEYVGAPSAYADEAEVPEVIGLLARIVAGGVLSWSVIVLVAGLLAFGCAVCFLVSFLAGSVLR